MVFRLKKRDSWKEIPEQARRDVSLCDHLCTAHRVPVFHERRLPNVGCAERARDSVYSSTQARIAMCAFLRKTD